MKILVTGAAGQLGCDLMEELARRGHDAIGVDLPQLDITDADACARVIGGYAPEAVIHCAAWTAVDAAEEQEEACRAVNALGTQNIARVCAQLGCRMMYISTDYVFDGRGDAPWEPDCKAYAPKNVYGRTKLEGEAAVVSQVEAFFIVRIAWVFGLHGKNFVKTMLGLGQKHAALRVVDDQIGTPTYTPDLARLLADMIVTDRYGYYHATNEGGFISWAQFAQEIMRQAGLGAQIIPVTTAEYGLSKAVRPFNSRLSKEKLTQAGFERLPHWQDALSRYLAALRSEA